MSNPTTERGHLYVKLARGLVVRRELSHMVQLSQRQEADVAEQLDELWLGMDDAEQARVEGAIHR